MRISDWSSDVCSSDLAVSLIISRHPEQQREREHQKYQGKDRHRLTARREVHPDHIVGFHLHILSRMGRPIVTTTITPRISLAISKTAPAPSRCLRVNFIAFPEWCLCSDRKRGPFRSDRKSTRLNSR